MSMESPKILCVDDEMSILNSLERLLKTNFQFVGVTSPKAALEWLKKNLDCAVVLSDFQMPEMNGVEFLREVKKISPHSARAILSGQIDLQQISAAINGADTHKFFLKPWENDYLLVQILEAVQLHKTLAEKAHYEILSITDPVTHLTNHRFFQDRIRLEIQKASESDQPLALILIDVDHFKAFNDRFGHPDGDQLLLSIATKLDQRVGEKGFVSRYGGEEFTVILPATSATEACALAEELRLHLENSPFTGLAPSPAYITISAGVATYPDCGETANELIESADRALYQAKRQGRNQVILAPLGTQNLRR